MNSLLVSLIIAFSGIASPDCVGGSALKFEDSSIALLVESDSVVVCSEIAYKRTYAFSGWVCENYQLDSTLAFRWEDHCTYVEIPESYSEIGGTFYTASLLTDHSAIIRIQEYSRGNPYPESATNDYRLVRFNIAQ